MSGYDLSVTPSEPDETDPTVAELRRLCTATAARLTDPALRERVTAVHGLLGRPLRVAVAGAVSGGKSTLVNALLGRSVAPADAGESTRLVTFYEYGTDDGVVLAEMDTGEVHTTRLDPDGRFPADLGVPVEWVTRVRVLLDRPGLRRLTVIDTPGVNTVTVANERAARRMLFGTDGDDHADALIYVLRYVQRFDADTLAEFRTLTAACGMTAVNTLAVLSQIDRRGDETDPWPSARRLAARAYDDLRTSVFDVVPVIGLLAETARAGLLGADDLAVLRELAGLDEFDLDDLLLDIDEFGSAPDFPGPVTVRSRLAGHLHTFGIRVATDAVRNRPDLDAAGLNEVLRAASGFDRAASGSDPGVSGFEQGVSGFDRGAAREGAGLGSVAAGIAHFARRAEQLKALAAVHRLRVLTRVRAEGGDRHVLAQLAEVVDEGRPITGALSGLRVLAAVEAAGRGQLPLGEDMLTELLRLARADQPAARVGLPADAAPDNVADAARAASIRWRRLAVTVGNRVAGQRARDVLGVFEDIAAAPEPVAPVAAFGARPPVPMEEIALRLLAAPTVGTDDRASLKALLNGENLAAQVGAEPGADAATVAERAAALGARFRIMLHRPLPAADRRAVTAVCDAYEAIWASASSLHQPAPIGRTADVRRE
jgi:GTPase SAR1 family protein